MVRQGEWLRGFVCERESKKVYRDPNVEGLLNEDRGVNLGALENVARLHLIA